MSNELDDLARSAAEALVTAMVTDSWEAVKGRFASLLGPGQQKRLDATHAAMAAARGEELQRAELRETQLWSTRFRDLLDDDSAAAPGLRILVADLSTMPATRAPASQHAQASQQSQAVNIGGSVTGNTGEVYVGVGKVDKRRRVLLVPVTFFVRTTKKAFTAHPVVATVTAGAIVAASAGAVVAQSAGASAMASMVGDWQGTYTCQQGLTGVSLQIAPEQNGAVAVTEDTYPVPANPTVPRGSDYARGTLSGTTVDMKELAWRVKPASDWVLGSFYGTLPAPGADGFKGTVTGPGCTTFSVHRAPGPPAASVGAATWTGTYTCAQGLTALRLTIKAVAGDALRATFAFSAVPSNPSVPSGSYSMTGFIDPAGIFLDGSRWITQPSGWDMVNVVTNLPTDHGADLSGSVPGCSPVSLKRS
jgi:hypothetical protein